MYDWLASLSLLRPARRLSMVLAEETTLFASAVRWTALATVGGVLALDGRHREVDRVSRQRRVERRCRWCVRT